MLTTKAQSQQVARTQRGLPNEMGYPSRLRVLRAFVVSIFTKRPLLFVLLAVIVVRVATFVVFNDVFAFDRTGVVHGSSAYLTYAENLIATRVYGKLTPGVPDAHLPPLYSYVLAFAWGVFSGGQPSSWVVAALHTAFDCIAAGSLFFVCVRLFRRHGRAIGLLAGLFYACYPYLVFQNLTLIDTPLFMALLYAFLACIVRIGQPHPPAPDATELLPPSGEGKYSALKDDLALKQLAPPLRAERGRGGEVAFILISGILLGLLGLVRPNAALFALLAGVWLVTQIGWRRAVVALVPMGAAAALVLAPWIVRNYGVFGQFVPVALNGGENFYQGNNAYTVPFLRAGYDPQWVPPPDIPAFADGFGVEANNARAAAGWQFLRDHPDAIPGLIVWKSLVHWSIDIAPVRNPTEGELPRPDYVGDAVIEQGNAGLTIGALPPGDPVGAYSGGLFNTIGRPLHIVYFGGLLLLAVVGLWLTRWEWRVLWLLYAMQLANMFLYVVFHPSTRYRAPTDPLLFAFSAAALVWLWNKVKRQD